MREMGEEQRRPRVSYVIGPDGSPLTLADLPPPNTKRWVIRRKAEVVAAVRGGLLSLEDACRRYTLTVEEFLAWQRAIERFGLPGLRATRASSNTGIDEPRTEDPSENRNRRSDVPSDVRFLFIWFPNSESVFFESARCRQVKE